MKIRMVTIILIISCMPAYGSITEKLRINSDKITKFKKDIKSGNIKRDCRGCNGNCIARH